MILPPLLRQLNRAPPVQYITMNTAHAASTDKSDKFLTDLRSLVTDAERLLDESTGADEAGNGSALRERFEAVQERFSDLYSGAKKRIIDGGKRTDKTIRENPYQSLAITAGVALLVGVLIGRRAR
jgi:ElaB/YqjD/DUF883 family membrane-anchored ribosome-binding protein